MQKHATINREATADLNQSRFCKCKNITKLVYLAVQIRQFLQIFQILQILQMSTNTIAIPEQNSSPARSLVVALKPPRRIPDLPLLQHDELPPREEVNRCRDHDELVTGR